MHVTSVCLSWQTVPASAQTDESHVHDAESPAAVQVWWAPQLVVVAHCVQPFDCVWHVSTPFAAEAHRLRPAVHCAGHASPSGPPSGVAPTSPAVSSGVDAPTSAPASIGVNAPTSAPASIGVNAPTEASTPGTSIGLNG